MTAISKAWVSVADSAVDPDSPLDSQLMTGLRDDLIHLREWLGASFEAGAVQDHNHDGSNSALIPVGPNLLRNGSFENGGTGGWTVTQYTGGTVATNTSNPLDGATSLAFTSTVLANGGGDATSNEFIPVTGGLAYTLNGAVKAGAANLSGKLEVLWFDNTQSSISTSVAFTSNSLPTSSTPVGGTVSAPATARYMKVKVTGHIAGSSAPVTTGTLYWDGISLCVPSQIALFVTPGTYTFIMPADTVNVGVQAGGGGDYSGTYAGGGGAYLEGWAYGKKGTSITITVGAGGVINTSGGTSSFGTFFSCTGGSSSSGTAAGGTATPSTSGIGSGAVLALSGGAGGGYNGNGGNGFLAGSGSLYGSATLATNGGGGSGTNNPGGNGFVWVRW